MSLEENKINRIIIDETGEETDGSENAPAGFGAVSHKDREEDIKIDKIVLDAEEQEEAPVTAARSDEEIRFDETVLDEPEEPEEDYLDMDAEPVAEQPTVHLNRSVVAATVYDWLGSLVTALVLVLLVMTFGFRIIDVDGRSMEPTLIDTDKVAITNLFYTPHQGDIVIISHAEEYQKPLVKRVIATAGQQLRLDYANNAVYVDGVKLDEPYIQGTTIPGDIPEEELNTVVPEGKVFVMGDNRGISLDSRYRQIGYIDVDSIIGKAQLDVIPHKYVNGSDKSNLKFDISGIRYVYQ